jgi:hypothetical protein
VRRATPKIAAAFAALAGAIPVAFAAVCARGDGMSAACDEAVVRVIGRGWTGALHGLDAIAGVPLGLNAKWASIVCLGLLGASTFTLAWRLVRTALPDWLGLVIALSGSTIATLSAPVQHEASLVGGSVMGALLATLPMVLASEGAPASASLAALGLAASYDAMAFAAAALSLGALALLGSWRPRPRDGIALFIGAIPVAWMMWRGRVAPEASLDVGPFSGVVGEGAKSASRSIAFGIVRSEIGIIALAFAGVGVIVAVRARVTRPVACAALGLALVGVASPAFGAPAGPLRFGDALLASLVAIAAFAAYGMGTVASWVSNANIPLAKASAAMIVLLELVIPVRIADDTSLAMSRTKPDTTTKWNATAFGSLPQNSVLLLPSPRLFLRARAAAATGALRSDVIVIPTFGLGSRATGREIAREPLVAPLIRDLALYGAPEEFSVSQLAQTRPLVIAFDARWDKRFTRHLVPEGPFDRYYVEPRGGGDRLKTFTASALDATDPALADATCDILRARADAAKVTAEREYIDASNAEVTRASCSRR